MMNRERLKRAVLSIFLLAGIFFVSNSCYATIVGGKHDFKTRSYNPTGEICIVCHTPHNSDTTVANAPLWNHKVTTATYTLYSSPTLKASLGQPNGPSKLCLSCHDGTVATGAFGMYKDAPLNSAMSATSRLNIGKPFVGSNPNLSNDHPISFTYDTNLANQHVGIKDPETTPSGLPGATGSIKDDMLYGGKLECVTCHDVHQHYANSSLLVKSNAASALCLTCHDK